MTLAKLKNPVKQTFEKLNQDIKEVHTALNNYTKALDKVSTGKLPCSALRMMLTLAPPQKFKNLALPTAANDPFSSHPTLTNRAVAMHLLREGQFGVAATFISEANAKPPQLPPADGGVAAVSLGENDIVMEDRSWAQDFAAISADVDAMDDGNYRQVTSSEPYGLQEKFAHMYEILQSLREKHDLQPAVRWAQSQSDALELRGSNLEFELCRLQFVELYQGRGFDGLPGIDHEDLDGPMRALLYARTIFPSFATRYLRETSALLGSLAYAPELTTSPYRHIFYNHDVWEEIASSFVREFCGLLGLSEKSPLYTAVTAGGIALPVLKKLESVMGEVGGQWTSANELPVSARLLLNKTCQETCRRHALRFPC